MFVYVVTNKNNGKRYVGQHSGNSLVRYWNHCIVHALNGIHGKNRLLYRAIRKYGSENFIISPLVIVNSKEEMDRYEIGMIAAWDLRNPEKGYNLAAGGKGTIGYKFSKVSLERLSNSHKGLKQSEETKQKRAASLRGQKRSEQTKKKMSLSQLGNKGRLGDHKTFDERRKISNSLKGNKNALGAFRSEEYRQKLSNIFKGRKFSEETLKRMSEAAKRRKDSDETRKKKSNNAKLLGLQPPKLSSEEAAQAGRISGHKRYHVNRGIVNPQCALCQELNNGLVNKSTIQGN